MTIYLHDRIECIIMLENATVKSFTGVGGVTLGVSGQVHPLTFAHINSPFDLHYPSVFLWLIVYLFLKSLLLLYTTENCQDCVQCWWAFLQMNMSFERKEMKILCKTKWNLLWSFNDWSKCQQASSLQSKSRQTLLFNYWNWAWGFCPLDITNVIYFEL